MTKTMTSLAAIVAKIKRAAQVILPAFLITALGLAGWTLWMMAGRYQASIYRTPESVPEGKVAIVFGAGYWPSGRLSDILRDRVDAAIALYRAQRVQKLLFSGDNRIVEYNEPEKMLEYALEQGVPREDIVLDYAGRRTYDTCYRARDIFKVEEAILVTQRYHLPRALYTCQALGIEAEGYIADRVPYLHIRRYWAREIPALWLSWVDLNIRHPIPILGTPLPIFPE